MTGPRIQIGNRVAPFPIPKDLGRDSRSRIKFGLKSMMYPITIKNRDIATLARFILYKTNYLKFSSIDATRLDPLLD